MEYSEDSPEKKQAAAKAGQRGKGMRQDSGEASEHIDSEEADEDYEEDSVASNRSY